MGDTTTTTVLTVSILHVKLKFPDDAFRTPHLETNYKNTTNKNLISKVNKGGFYRLILNN